MKETPPTANLDKQTLRCVGGWGVPPVDRLTALTATRRDE